MTDFLFRLGRSAARHPWTAIGAWLAVAAVVLTASASFGRTLEDSSDVPGLDSQRAADVLEAAGSQRAGLTAQIVVAGEPSGAQLADIRAGAARLPHVLTTSQSVSSDGRVAVVRVQYPEVEELAPADLEALKDFAAGARERSDLEIETGGDLFFAFEESGGVGELAGIAAAALILLVAFGSLIAMGLPIGMAVFGLAVGIGAMPLVAHLIDVPIFAPELASMIGLGVGIDYALFILTRHREHLETGASAEEAAGHAVATAGRAVIFAGGIVVVAILGLAVAGVPFMTATAVAISVVVLIMVLSSITLLPAFLGLAGRRLVRRRRPSATKRWARWGAHVSRHPRAYAAGGAILLLALAAPALDLRLGNPDDGHLPPSRTERRAYDLVAQGFGPGANGPLTIAVDDARAADAVRDAVAADPGIASVAPPERRGDVATVIAFPATAPQDEATRATIERLRADVLPAALAGRSAHAHVGGQTAMWTDIGDRLQARLPLFVIAVVGLSSLLLALVFRSVLVPATAAVMNLLSAGAAYGVLVMVFQWGWGAGLIGLESTVPIVPFIPVFMFAILFGLSMDYEVFLLSRIRERYLATGDSDASVIEGLGGTARVITSAALIMIAVFLGFVLGDDPRIKMFGLGLATAIFVDATVVRLVLVPATMKLLGDANWWFPRLGGQRRAGSGRVTSPSATAQSIVRANVSATGVYESPSSRSASEPS